MRAMVRMLGRMIANLLTFLVFFLLLGGMAEIARNSLSFVSEWHWMATVFLAAVWLIGIFVLCFAIWYAMRPSAPGGLRKYVLVSPKAGQDAGLAEQFPGAALSALICAAMLTAVFVLTGLSAVLASQGLVTYAVETAPDQPMTELLFRLYMWHTIDMIPFVELWNTYDVRPPIRPTDFTAQTIVLVFRTAIVGFAISVIVQWLGFNHDTSTNNVDA